MRIDKLIEKALVGKVLLETEFVPNTEGEREYYKEHGFPFPPYPCTIRHVEIDSKEAAITLWFKDNEEKYPFFFNDTLKLESE